MQCMYIPSGLRRDVALRFEAQSISLFLRLIDIQDTHPGSSLTLHYECLRLASGGESSYPPVLLLVVTCSRMLIY